jgi:hypothetical protein
MPTPRPTWRDAVRWCACACACVDASLRETLHLSGLELPVSEWLPWGANQVVALNER